MAKKNMSKKSFKTSWFLKKTQKNFKAPGLSWFYPKIKFSTSPYKKSEKIDLLHT